MSTLRKLVEDLRTLVPLAIVGAAPTQSARAEGVSSYERLAALVDALADSPELDTLSPEEFRALKSFKLTIFRAGPMELTTARKHVGATWRGAAKQAILKVSICSF